MSNQEEQTIVTKATAPRGVREKHCFEQWKTQKSKWKALEGDIVDRAIESLQHKADNIKKLLITLTPVFILLTGGSMEAFGIIDVWDSDNINGDDDYYEIWGCTAWDAENYDPDATHDDGSCWWDDNSGGEGRPPQNCDWRWDDSFLTPMMQTQLRSM